MWRGCEEKKEKKKVGGWRGGVDSFHPCGRSKRLNGGRWVDGIEKTKIDRYK